MTSHAFAELATAAYCPRKLYYRRRDGDWEPPPEVEARREIAFRYDELLADPTELDVEPLAVPPEEWRRNVERRRRRDDWSAIVRPADREVFVSGRRCHGVLDKLLDLDGPVPGIVSGGTPPDRGVWEPDGVRAVAAAKALSWERETRIERAVVEYPAAGAIREIRITTRRRAAYKRALRAVESMDGPPPRLRNRAKCGACEYRETCGVRTRTLGSLL